MSKYQEGQQNLNNILLARLWGNRNSLTVLVEMENDTTPTVGDIIIFNKITHVFTFWLMYPYVNIYLYACMLSHFSHVQVFAILWTVAC